QEGGEVLAERDGVPVGGAGQRPGGVHDGLAGGLHQQLGRRVRVPGGVQRGRDGQLRRTEGLAAAQVVPQRQVVERGHEGIVQSKRAFRAAPWAGRSSASASATTRAVASARASRSYSTTWTPRRNDCTDSPDEWQAHPPVGRTWLDPA